MFLYYTVDREKIGGGNLPRVNFALGEKRGGGSSPNNINKNKEFYTSVMLFDLS